MPSFVEIGPVVLEKKIFKFRQYILPLLLVSPLEKGQGPLFVQIWILFTQGCFVPCLVKICPVVWEKKKTMWKVYDNDDYDNDDDAEDDEKRTNCDQKSTHIHIKQKTIK